jgi:starch synthase
MRLLFASAEVFPLAKTGGLADVSAAPPLALADLGVHVQLVMPGYTEALDRAEGKQASLPIHGLPGIEQSSLVPARLPHSGLPIWLLDCPELYRRKGGLYLDDEGRDWPDNAQRFATLSYAVARMALGAVPAVGPVDVVHANDWHLGLVPALLAAEGGIHPPSVLTIHNLAFQGVFPAEVFPQLGLPPHWFTPDTLEFYGKLSMLKAGICFADRLTTVSPSYAQEILTPEFGCGLDGFLRARADHLTGILNGIDYGLWTPEDPIAVPYPYDFKNLMGKRRCKAALQAEMGLPSYNDTPLIAFISRLTEQKMADVLPEIMPAVAAQGAQFIVCGEGDGNIQQALKELEARYPQQFVLRLGYEEPLARRILAGADILAAPSRFEPCGLVQMYAMRYGTIPIVRNVGGLSDTVVRHEHGLPNAEATGFIFDESTAASLADAIERAVHHYRKPVAWRAMQVRAMKQDFRWTRSAQRYLSLYDELVPAKEALVLPASMPELERFLATGS